MVNITLTIPTDKINEFKLGFLKHLPIPIDEDTGEPLFTELEWFTEALVRYAKQVYRRGKQKIAAEEYFVDDGVIS